MIKIEKTTPDKEKAKNLLETVNVRIEAIDVLKKTNSERFSSKIIEEYYEAIFELVSAIMSIDGYKPMDSIIEKHLTSIRYMRSYTEFNGYEIQVMDDLRKRRIGIKYYGLQVPLTYLNQKEKDIKSIVSKLKDIINKKI